MGCERVLEVAGVPDERPPRTVGLAELPARPASCVRAGRASAAKGLHELGVERLAERRPSWPSG